nr:LuxR C-terminal-related transcriptional regulator [Neobacillus sp. Marseille-Q6967]
MERKVEQLLHKGLSIVLELKEPFLTEWKQLSKTVSHKNSNIVNHFHSMVEFALKELSNNETPSADSFILSLLAEWQNRFSSNQDEYDTIFLLTAIENLFHKLLVEFQSATSLDHHAIQTLFSRIWDHTLLTLDYEEQHEKWLKMLLATNILPMEWIALIKKEQSDFKIESVVTPDAQPVSSHLLGMCSGLKAAELEHLSTAITRLLVTEKEETLIVQVDCLNDILLIKLKEKSFPVTAQQTELIRGMYLRLLKLHHLENKMEWKDASLLFLQRLLPCRTPEQAVHAVTKGLVDYMPFKRCALFLYNHYEAKGIGVSGYNVNSPSVQKIREEIFQLPLIKKYLPSLFQSQPLYFSNAAEVLPDKYVKEFSLKSLVVLPIFVSAENRLIGIALLDQGEDTHFDLSAQTLTTLVKFGQYSGELLYSLWDEALQQFGAENGVLTLREKEVLKLIAKGASINEAAQQLHLSSYTVRDYVSVIIQKLAAKNRTDAAVKAIRMKLIS